MKKYCLVTAGLSLSAAFATTALAQDRTLYWNGSVNGNWSNASNWNELSSDNVTLLSTTTAPVSGDEVVLTGFGVTTTNQDIADLVVDAIWFAPSNDTIVVNGLTLGVNSGGTSIVDGTDFVGTVAARVEATSGDPTLTVTVSPLQFGSNPNIEQFLLAVDAGTVLVNGAGSSSFLDGLVVASVDPVANTITTTVPPTSSGTNLLITLPSNFDLNVPLELHGNNDSEVFFHVARTEGTTDFDFLITANAAGDIVGLRMEGGEDLPADLGFNNAFVTLSNDNNDFLGGLESAPTNGRIILSSIGAAGVPSSAGAGDRIQIAGGGGNAIEYTGGNISTDRTLEITGGGAFFLQSNSDAVVDWTGPINISSGGGIVNLNPLGTWNQFGLISGTSARQFEKDLGGTLNIFQPDNPLAGNFLIQNGDVGAVVIGDVGEASSLGEADDINFPSNSGGDLVYIGDFDESTDRTIQMASSNVRPTIRNASSNGSSLTLNGVVDNPITVFDFRELGFDAEEGDIIINANRVSRDDGNGGYQYQSSGNNTVFVNVPGSATGAVSVDGNVVVPSTNVAEGNVTVTVGATITGVGFTQSALDTNVQITVNDTSGLKPGYLAIHPDLFNGDTAAGVGNGGGIEVRSVIFSVDSPTELTLSASPSEDITVGEQITFIGYAPLGYDYITMDSGDGVLNINTTLINSDIDGAANALELNVGGGSTGDVVTGNGALAPFLADQSVLFSGGSTLAPGNSIGTLTFGSVGTPLSSFVMANTATLDIEISGDTIDSVDVFASENFQFTNTPIDLTNIGSGAVVPGDYVVIQNVGGDGLNTIGAPSIGDVTGLSGFIVTLFQDDDFFPTAYGVTIAVDLTADDVLTEFLSAFPGANDDPTSDEDNDGSTLLEELIGNTSPVNNDEVPLVEFIIINDSGTDFPGIRFTRPTADEVTAVAEADDDLTAGGVFTGGVTLFSAGAPFTGNGGVEYEVVEFRSNNPLNAANPQQFLRVAGELVTP
ncbi:MAG: beta strand repeat-containing protein [Opitutales bacterium]